MRKQHTASAIPSPRIHSEPRVPKCSGEGASEKPLQFPLMNGYTEYLLFYKTESLTGTEELRAFMMESVVLRYLKRV